MAPEYAGLVTAINHAIEQHSGIQESLYPHDESLVSYVDTGYAIELEYAEAVQIHTRSLGIVPKNRPRVPGSRPLRLALVDPLMLLPILPLFVSASRGMGSETGERMLLQREIAIAPAAQRPAAQPVVDLLHHVRRLLVRRLRPGRNR